MSIRTATILSALFAFTALASPDYPGEIQTHLGLANIPPQSCTLCHPGATGSGTATSPFARALQMNGLTSGNAASLRAALDAMETAGTDSDGDGVGDVAELRAGTNPNVADQMTGTGGGAGGGGGSTVVLPPLTYGCGADVSPGLFVLVALVPLIRRRFAR
ncbi:MAG: hypothetical protein JNM17_11720 [Archangium sp.]|nr:hypothetical protein [Archangium sp.]